MRLVFQLGLLFDVLFQRKQANAFPAAHGIRSNIKFVNTTERKGVQPKRILFIKDAVSSLESMMVH